MIPELSLRLEGNVLVVTGLLDDSDHAKTECEKLKTFKGSELLVDSAHCAVIGNGCTVWDNIAKNVPFRLIYSESALSMHVFYSFDKEIPNHIKFIDDSDWIPDDFKYATVLSSGMVSSGMMQGG